MESLAAPSVEAMTPSTPLLPPNAFPAFPSGPLVDRPTSQSNPTTTTVTAPRCHHPYARVPYPLDRVSPQPRRHPRARKNRREG